MEKTNYIDKAVELLKKELEVKHSKMVPVVPILNYLIDKVENDEELSKRVLIEKKTFKECIEYLTQEVKKLLKERKTYWLDDQEVYDIAESYYILDEVKIDKPEPRPISIPKNTTKTTVQTRLEEIKSMSKVEVKKKEEQISLFSL